jgi:hypothetical protein
VKNERQPVALAISGDGSLTTNGCVASLRRAGNVENTRKSTDLLWIALDCGPVATDAASGLPAIVNGILQLGRSMALGFGELAH